MNTFHRLWREDDGVLTFEWVLLVTILTIGIVGGFAAARDGIVDELGDIAQGVLALDQTFRIDYAPDIVIREFHNHMGGSDSHFYDWNANFSDDTREPLEGQEHQVD